VPFTRLFDTVATTKRVTRAGDTYHVMVATATVVATGGAGYLTSVDALVTADSGSARHSTMTFSKIGTAPAMKRPPSSEIQDKPPDRAPGR
jgi:hypothetical protein